MSVSLNLKSQKTKKGDLTVQKIDQQNKMATFNESSLTRELRGHKDPKINQEIDALVMSESYD